MSRSLATPDYFEAMYRADVDPWRYATSAYEARKYAATLAALPRPRYRCAWEIGCSIGVFTERLAAHCDRLLAVDVSVRALELAAARCCSRSHVRFARMQVPDELPDGVFDLVVLSEVGYYWSYADLDRARRAIVAWLEPGGHLLLVHWTLPISDAPLTGDEVHSRFLADSALRHLDGQRAESYRLDLLERR